MYLSDGSVLTLTSRYAHAGTAVFGGIFSGYLTSGGGQSCTVYALREVYTPRDGRCSTVKGEGRPSVEVYLLSNARFRVSNRQTQG